MNTTATNTYTSIDKPIQVCAAKTALPISKRSNCPTINTKVVSLNNPIEVLTIEGIVILIA